MKLKECPRCFSKDIILSGTAKGEVRKKCNNCSNHFTVVKKKTAISSKVSWDIYQRYSYENLPISNFSIKGTISHVTLNKWIKHEYWLKARDNSNVFRDVAKNGEYVKSISRYFRNVNSTIRVKPLKRNVVIQYLVDGYKTDIRKTVTLFTLLDFEEKFGDNYCTVRFDILNIVKNKLQLFEGAEEKKRLAIKGEPINSNIEIQDFISDELVLNNEFNTDDLTHQSGRRNVINKITINDFLEFFLSDTKNFNTILILANQGLRIVSNIKTREQVWEEHRNKSKEKVLEIQLRRKERKSM